MDITHLNIKSFADPPSCCLIPAGVTAKVELSSMIKEVVTPIVSLHPKNLSGALKEQTSPR